ncbi:hypothetical protein KM043_006862 [Ampulex compressa]|nr:hypothetical protein KM043_006862 [Ampulex compressa]
MDTGARGAHGLAKRGNGIVRDERTDVRAGGSQLPFITLLGPIDITDWYAAPTPPSKDLMLRRKGANAVTRVCSGDRTRALRLCWAPRDQQWKWPCGLRLASLAQVHGMRTWRFI